MAVKLKPVVLRRVVRSAVREKSPNDRVDCGSVSSSLFAEASENNDVVDPLELCFRLQTPKRIASASDINDGAHVTPDDGTLATDFTARRGQNAAPLCMHTPVRVRPRAMEGHECDLGGLLVFIIWVDVVITRRVNAIRAQICRVKTKHSAA